MFPTGMFATATQRKVLRVLAEKNRRYTTDELAEMCHRSQPSISRALKKAERYPFIEKANESGTKRHLFGLDSESEYSAAIRDFFEIERRRERRNGTVPVEIWNLLEDVTERLTSKLDTLLEVYLFGSYARGDFYTGSDIDLLLVVEEAPERNRRKAMNIIEDIDPDKEIQLVSIGPDNEEREGMGDSNVIDAVRYQAPVDETEPLIPLVGNLES